MSTRTGRPLTVLRAASSAGSYDPGQEIAPEALIERGLLEALAVSRRVEDRGEVARAVWQRVGDPRANNVAEVQRVALAVAGGVQEALDADHDALVLGGDCTVELGTVAGALRSSESVGLLYLDLDADLTTTVTGDGILDWMGVAHLLAAPDTHPDLVGLGPVSPMLAGPDVILVGVDNVTAPERHLIDTYGVRVEPLARVRADPAALHQRLAAWAQGYDIVLVHVDVDVLSFEDFPIAENTRVRDGLTLSELQALVTDAMALPNARCLTWCEVNPAHAPDRESAMTRLVGLLASALAR